MFEFLTQMMAGGQGTTLPVNQGTMPQMSPDQWTNNPVANGGQPSGGGGVAGLLADPNFQSMLAGIGTNLDPDGVGGAIGKPTHAMIQNKQMGKAMEKQDRRWLQFLDVVAGKGGQASYKEDPKGGKSFSYKAPENTLGTLEQPMQQNAPQPAIEQSPFSQYMNNMQSWFQKFGGM